MFLGKVKWGGGRAGSELPASLGVLVFYFPQHDELWKRATSNHSTCASLSYVWDVGIKPLLTGKLPVVLGKMAHLQSFSVGENTSSAWHGSKKWVYSDKVLAKSTNCQETVKPSNSVLSFNRIFLSLCGNNNKGWHELKKARKFRAEA